MAYTLKVWGEGRSGKCLAGSLCYVLCMLFLLIFRTPEAANMIPVLQINWGLVNLNDFFSKDTVDDRNEPCLCPYNPAEGMVHSDPQELFVG